MLTNLFENLDAIIDFAVEMKVEIEKIENIGKLEHWQVAGIVEKPHLKLAQKLHNICIKLNDCIEEANDSIKEYKKERNEKS